MQPFRHAFRYRIFQLFLDLESLEKSGNTDWAWPARWLPILQFRRRDYVGSAGQSLAATVRDLVQQQTGQRPAGPIRLLTLPRQWGFSFNPVSFYYCYREDGLELEAVVAEVRNTPWNERHCYVLERPQSADEPIELPKAFHVSPFFDLQMDYRFRLTIPGDDLAVGIENWKDGIQVFTAGLSARRWRPSSRNLLTLIVLNPWVTAWVVFAIYWQALKLWWKGAAYVPHPNPPARRRLTTP